MNIITDRMRLREPCEAVSFKEGCRIGQILVEELASRSNAIGLAAPQIGIKANVFAVKPENGQIYFVVNPKILFKKEKFLFEGEGCLSFPNEKLKTVRFKELQFSDDRNSEPTTISGLEAVVFDHENDHIEGVIFFDREIKPYDACFCESGKKFKFCCAKK